MFRVYKSIKVHRKQIAKLLSHPLFVVIFSCLCLLSLISLRESSKKALISKESIQKLEKNTELMEKELAKEKNKFENKREGIVLEKIVRSELLQQKEGEIILQIPDEENSNDHINDNSTIENNQPLKEWWKLLFFSI